MKKLLALVSVAAVSTPAFAYRQYLNDFTGHYDTNTIVVDDLVGKESCGLCHNRASGGGARNSYGQDFEQVTLGQSKGYPGIEFLDSDNDTFVNLEEIYLQTSPSKSAEAPKARIELSFDKATGVLSSKVTAACLKLEVKAFGVTIGGKADASFDNVAATQDITLTGTQGAVLARCEAEGFVGSLVLP
jgi:hypothetical protein